MKRDRALHVFQSDWGRASAALVVSLAGAATLVAAKSPLPSETAAEPVVYTIINMTERMADRQACPLDLALVREQIESGFAQTGHELEYSPLADGPEVLLHELSAEIAVGTGQAPSSCAWTIRVSYQGQSHTQQAHAAPSQAPGALDAMALEVGALLVTSAR